MSPKLWFIWSERAGSGLILAGRRMMQEDKPEGSKYPTVRYLLQTTDTADSMETLQTFHFLYSGPFGK